MSGLVCVTLLSASGGCTISEKDCLRGDWQTIGFKDGKAGKSADLLNRYAKSCEKHGTSPDPAAYTAGFQAGIVLYCTPENGFTEGEKNRNYSGACPAKLERTFLDSYVEGLRIAIDDLEIVYDREQIELDRLRDKRARRIKAEEPHDKLDKEIDYLRDSLSRNTQQRQSINNRIRKWQAP